jgi:broad specificity phosphatase PhoE
MVSDPRREFGPGADVTVLLCRHGRTALNAQGVLRGRLDPPLDEVGVAEAEALARALVPWRPHRVLSSPRQRAVQTASVVATVVGLAVEVDPRLDDRDYGEWAGLPAGDLEARFGSVDAAPGVEAIDAVVARARRALADAAAEAAGGTAVLVAHDAVNRALLCALDPSLGDPERLSQPTGCVNVLERSGGRWRIDVVGRVSTGRRRPEA